MITSLRRRPVRALLLVIALLAAFGTATALAASSTVKVEDSFFSAKKLSVSRGASVIRTTWTRAMPQLLRGKRPLHGFMLAKHTRRCPGRFSVAALAASSKTRTVRVNGDTYFSAKRLM